VTLVGIDEHWREQLRVMFRKRAEHVHGAHMQAACGATVR
jgi:hypothetical protein